MSLTQQQLDKRRANANARVATDIAKRQQTLGIGVPAPAERAIQQKQVKYWKRRGIKCEKSSRSLIKKIRQAVKVELSGKVSQQIYDKRVASCCQCPHVSERAADGKHFCECCGCPAWTFNVSLPGVNALGSDIESKNWHTKNECPAPEPLFGAVE